MHKTCSDLSQTKIPMWKGGGECEDPPLTEELMAFDGCQENESLFLLLV